MSSLEDRIEDLPEPELFKKYFEFLNWKWGRYIILTWWSAMMILGMSYGFELLNLTDFEFKPPSGTDAHKAQQEFRDKFHSIASTSELIVYYTCANAECNVSYPITRTQLHMQNMSAELNASLLSYSASHDNIIFAYGDYYAAKEKCGIYFRSGEYTTCTNEIQKMFISSEGTSAIGSIRYDAEADSSDARDMDDYIKKECERISKEYGNGIVVKFTGQSPMVQDMGKASRDDVEKKDVYTIPLALCVLAVVVRTWRTMFIPLLCVFGSICTSFSIMRPVAEYGFTINPFAPSIMTSVTVAMSIDYSLFLLTRFREEIEKQHNKGIKLESLDVVYAVRQVTRWSGKVVAFSGFILSITYVGLVAYPMSMLQSVGLGTSIAVLCTILINLTLTPALLLMFPDFFKVLGCRLPEICERVLARYGIQLNPESKNDKYEHFIDDEENSFHDHMLKVQPAGNGALNINSTDAGHDHDHDHDHDHHDHDHHEHKSAAPDDIHPFEIPKDERENWCNRCWFECGSYSTMWPYSIIIIIVVYALIAPIGWRISELRKQLDDTLIFPRNSDYLATYNEVEDDFSPGMLAAWYIIIPDPNYEEGNPDKNVRSWAYVQDTGSIMTQLFNKFHEDGYPMSSSIGISVFNNQTFPNIVYYKEATMMSAYRDFSDNFISKDNSTTYFKMISSFDPYYTNAIDFVEHARDLLDTVCSEGSYYGNTSYTCYLTGGSTNEVDLVNTIFAQFPYVLLIIVIVVFCVMGLFFASTFVPVRLFITIAVPLTLVYGISILVYQKGSLNGLNWAALADTDGLYWLSPVMTVTILIGLALDYDVFLFARVYEYRLQGVPTREAIVRGVYNTGSIITAAGVIMAIAFCGLLFSQITSLNQTGFILVVAVLVDTFIIRTLLVPAVLSMAKEINWWPGIKLPARKLSNEKPSIALTGRYDNPTLHDEEVVM